ncbi:MAG: transcriptional regulator [Firmicutes bacterium]|nr:transcriptional regulator [Bacillota bacterium]
MDNLSAFVETLQDLMLVRRIKPDDINRSTGISLSVIYTWLKKSAVPNLNSLVVLSDYFGCSVDYLCGRTEHNSVASVNPTPFPDRFRFLINKSGVSIRKLSAETRISTSGIQRFLKGTGKPLLENLVRLAVFFDCSVDYLIGRE